METIKTKSTSARSVECEPIVLRESAQVRLVFAPMLFDNPHDPDACVKGTFVYQRKRKHESWESVPITSLAVVAAITIVATGSRAQSAAM